MGLNKPNKSVAIPVNAPMIIGVANAANAGTKKSCRLLATSLTGAIKSCNAFCAL
jgi:hypothetical protein